MSEDVTCFSIGLFATNEQIQVLLDSLLCDTGYWIDHCRERELSLTACLEGLLQHLQKTGIAPYDLLMLEAPATEVIEGARDLLEQLARLQVMPVVLLTDPLELGQPPANVSVIPLVFKKSLSVSALLAAIQRTTGIALPLSEAMLRMVLGWYQKQFQTVAEGELAWVKQRRACLAQRQEWLDERQRWLRERQDWIHMQRSGVDPQYEWLNEQQKWLWEQQENLRLQRQILLYSQLVLHA